MADVSEALRNFLNARKTPANADLIERWSSAWKPRSTWRPATASPWPASGPPTPTGPITWHSIRIPKDANSEPSWNDYKLSFSFDRARRRDRLTGWDWQARRSRWVAFDFDAFTGHAKGVGISDEDLEKVKEAAMQLPYVEVRQEHGRRRHPPLRLLRRSRHPLREPHRPRRPGPLHPGHDVQRVQLRLRLPDRLLRRRHVDMAPEDDGREPGPRPHQAGHQGAHRGRPAGQLAGPHRSGHAQAHQGPHQRGRRRRPGPLRGPGLQPEDHSPGRQPQGADRGPAALRLHDPLDRRPPPVPDAHLRPERADGRPGGQGTGADRRLRDQLPKAGTPATPTASSFPCPTAAGGSSASRPASRRPTPGARTARGGPPATSTAGRTWQTAAKTRGGMEDPDKAGYTFKTPDDAVQVAKVLGQTDITVDPMFEGRKTTAQAAQGRPPGHGDRAQERGRRTNGAGRLARQEDEMGPRLRDHHQRQEGTTTSG